MSQEEIKISEDVAAFANKARAAIVLNKEGVFEVQSDFYIKELNEATGIDEKQYKDMQKFNSLFVAGAGLAVGEQANDAFKASKDATRFTVTVPTVGRDSFEFDVKRESVGRNPSTKEEVVSYGVLNASHTMKAVDKIGDYARVRESLKAKAKLAFGG